MKIIIFFLALFVVENAIAQNYYGDGSPIKKQLIRQQLQQRKEKSSSHERITSTGGLIFDTSNWSHLIDSTWGAGLSDTDKLSIFNQFWHPVDSNYAAFVNLPLYNWDSIIYAMQAEIMSGISRGRFAGIIGSLERYINDVHTHFYDEVVNYGAVYPYPGLPVYRGETGEFGACVTTLNDTQAIVYNVAPGHPFHLEPGDIILGYNGLPWLTLSKIMLRNQLPYGVVTGSTDSATLHRQIQAAGENWYLFDTINIQKCDGTLVNYPTSLMNGTHFFNFCTEQLPVPGVTQLTFDQYYYDNREVASGVLTGTRIGYIYMIDCEDISGDSLYEAVKTLVEDSLVQGLIFDIRTNYGGSISAFEPAFEYLHNGNVSWVGMGERTDTANKYAMYNPSGSFYSFNITDTCPNYFTGPVAILDGPNAVSGGDFFSVLFRNQPILKIFGKSGGGAFGFYDNMTLSDSDYYASMQWFNAFQVGSPSAYLSHTMFPVDVPMWFNRDSVCAGVDNIVSTAVQWIQGEGAEAIKETAAQQPFSVVVFPNPSNDYIDLSVSSSEDTRISVKLCNVLGTTVLAKDYNIHEGNNKIRMNGLNLLPPGSYYATINDDSGHTLVKKVTIIH